MEPKYDVIAMGELLIDFTENGYSEQGNHILEANPGAHRVMCWQCSTVWGKDVFSRNGRKRPVWSAASGYAKRAGN